MITYLIHTALMLLAAFLAGLILGKLIKWLFCRNKKSVVVPQDDYDAPSVLVPAEAEYDKRPARLGMTGDAQDMAEPEVRKSRLSMAGSGAAAVAATGTAAAGAKYAIDRLKADQSDVPTVDVNLPKTKTKTKTKRSSFQASFPEARAPVVDVDIPEVELPVVSAPAIEAPAVDLPSAHIDSELPRIAGLELSDFSMKTPTVDMDAADVELPVVAAELRDTDFPAAKMPAAELPNVAVEAPDIDVELPQVELNTPDVDLSAIKAPEINMPEIDLPEIKAPQIDLPDMNVDLLTVNTPDVDVDLLTVNAPDVDVDLPTVDLPEVKVPDIDVSVPDVNIDLPTVDLPDVKIPDVDLKEKGLGLGGALKGAALAAGAGVVAKVSGGFDAKAPDVDVNVPDVNVDLPPVNTPDIDLPQIDLPDVGLPEVGLPEVNMPGVNLDLPEVKAPDVDLPDLNIETPNLDIGADESASVEAGAESEGGILMQHLRSAKVKPNIKLPLVTDEGVIVETEAEATDLNDADVAGSNVVTSVGGSAVEATGVKGAVDANLATEVSEGTQPVTLDASELAPVIAAAAGVGVTHRLATAGSDEASANSAAAGADMSGLMTKIRQQMQAQPDGAGNRPRVITLEDSCQHCAGLGGLSAGGTEVLVLQSGEYDKLDNIHCGVTRSGFVAVGGNVSTISDNQVILFMMHNVAVCRNNDAHTFVIVAGE